MGKPRGFLEIRRSKADQRPIGERLNDFREFELPVPDALLREQAARCMDCGIPFCHHGCPLGNLIPDWNDHVLSGRWEEASIALHATNNFPEVTGRVCPAPCEASCVLNLETIPDQGDGSGRVQPGAVTIKQIEHQIADRAFDDERIRPQRSPVRSGRKVAVVGSGPAGLAAAQQLGRKGHEVVVFEKDDRIGGLLRYGIPDFKLEKEVIDRRLDQLRAEGVSFRSRVHVGVDVTGDALKKQFDAIVLCGGAIVPRDLPVPGRELAGVHFAMEFLVQQNKRNAGDIVPEEGAILATGRKVVVLGGGDTGSDCVGTSLRQSAESVTSLELMPRPPDHRRDDNPWPQWPLIYRTSSSHEEGGQRDFGVMTKAVLGDDQGRVRALEVVRVELKGGKLVELPGSAHEIPCDLLLLAMGFVGSPRAGMLEQLGVEMDARGNVRTHEFATSVPGVFAAGDMSRGQSLVVWAIAEGRKAAERVDAWLSSTAARVA
ncbi:MAG: glutamate synthase subunit beta [Deltaproteobacteria bacterium]|nr:glutamate synthase subunit beta [Deltaproteobacteria bacterium]